VVFDINDPLLVRPQQQIKDLFFAPTDTAPLSALGGGGPTPSHAVPLPIPRGISVSFRPGGYFQPRRAFTLGIQGAAQLQRQRRIRLHPHRRLPRRRLAHNSASASPRHFGQQFGEVPGTKTAIPCTTNAIILPLQNPWQAILAQFVLYTLQGEITNTIPDRSGKNTLCSHPFNFRADYATGADDSARVISAAFLIPADLPPFLARAGEISL